MICSFLSFFFSLYFRMSSFLLLVHLYLFIFQNCFIYLFLFMISSFPHHLPLFFNLILFIIVALLLLLLFIVIPLCPHLFLLLLAVGVDPLLLFLLLLHENEGTNFMYFDTNLTNLSQKHRKVFLAFNEI